MPLAAGPGFAGTAPLVPMQKVDNVRARRVMRLLDVAASSGESAETAMTGVELLRIAADENPRVIGALIAGATAVCVVDPHTAEAFFKSLRLLGLM